MGRARLISRELHCHNCDRRWHGTQSILDDHMRALHNLDPHQQSCSRCSLTHGDGTRCKFLPETCICPSPHVEIVSYGNSTGNIHYAQCRSDQRAAVYLMPDGSVSAPPSNKYDDCVALDAVAKGGVRYEFASVRDMQRFQRDHRKTEDDEFTERCLTIDYDQPTLRSGGTTYIRDQIRREDEERRKVLEGRDRGRIRYGGQLYEEMLRRKGRA